MAEKKKQLNLERDHRAFLYFIAGRGNVCRRPKSGKGKAEAPLLRAVERDNQYLYFIDKQGDISHLPRGVRKRAA